MSRTTVARLSAAVAEIKAKKMAALSAPLAAEALTAAGFRVYPFDGGLSVDAAPGLEQALDGLNARGVRPELVIIRNLEDEP